MLLSNLIQNPFNLLIFIVGFLVSITVHEYAHARVAYHCGDPTAKLDGRLSLNPLAHLDPLGTLFIFIVGFGWARPVPINPYNFKNRSDELKVALAGIAANLLLAFVLAIPIRIAQLQSVTVESSAILLILNFVVEINIALAAFNLLPVFPLDGSHLVEYFLEGSARIAYQSFGPYILLGIIILQQVSGIPILSLILEPIMRLFSLIVKGTMLTYF